jgi:hypothetical protein
MPSKISKILTELPYEWYQELPNKIIFEGEVWIQEINDKLNENNIKYKWCYEKGKATYYLIKE